MAGPVARLAARMMFSLPGARLWTGAESIRLIDLSSNVPARAWYQPIEKRQCLCLAHR